MIAFNYDYNYDLLLDHELTAEALIAVNGGFESGSKEKHDYYQQQYGNHPHSFLNGKPLDCHTHQELYS
ncbi:MAG: hypothetical protein AB8A49_09150 [Prochlorococcus sp.]|mgnify:FL=1|jgi:hypothetical protein|nr:hypothetical protein [Prochlorococcaceae cyanobacterium ETNP2_MAG_10]